MIKVQQSPSTDRLITDHFRITGQWLQRIAGKCISIQQYTNV